MRSAPPTYPRPWGTGAVPGRRFDNANVRTLNTKVETFPANVVAHMFGFTRAEYFEADDPQVRQAPTVGF